MPLILGFATVLGGMLIAAQGPIYARMAAALGGNPLFAAFLAFAVATCALGLVLVAARVRAPEISHLKLLPWWVWLGGLFGAYQVLISMQAVPRLGVTLFLMLVILGNLAAAAVFDHFGWFGLPQRPLGAGAIMGIFLMFTGVLLVAGRS